MKRTAYLIEECTQDGWKLADEKITCELYGEMDNGSKVWQDINGKQYFLSRMLGTYYFYGI